VHTKQYIPPPHLSAVVQHIAVLEDTVPEGIYTQLPFYADGCPGLIYQHAAGGMQMNDMGTLPPFFVYGQTVKPVILSPKGSFKMVVYFFYPYVLKSLFGIQSGEVTDTCLDLGLYPAPHLGSMTDALDNSPNTAQQLHLINQYLGGLFEGRGHHVESTVRYAVSQIITQKGQTSLQELRSYLHVTERTFERHFEQHVGVPPKTFLRISQFRAALRQIQQNQYTRLSDVAYANGYADQPHFIRSFKLFTGISPFEYVKHIARPGYAGMQQ
jgi:AraC-like DNA-binding protein